MIVVDASVLAPALADDGDDGDAARALLTGAALAAPELVDLEVLSVWRRQVRVDKLRPRRVTLALDDLARLPLRRIPHRPLARRCWELRGNLTVYDAAYVAAAEILDAPLLTADARLAAAPGIRCVVQLAGGR